MPVSQFLGRAVGGTARQEFVFRLLVVTRNYATNCTLLDEQRRYSLKWFTSNNKSVDIQIKFRVIRSMTSRSHISIYKIFHQFISSQMDLLPILVIALQECLIPDRKLKRKSYSVMQWIICFMCTYLSHSVIKLVITSSQKRETEIGSSCNSLKRDADVDVASSRFNECIPLLLLLTSSCSFLY